MLIINSDICDICNKQIEEPGGLLFSNPNSEGGCLKYRFCKNCYLELTYFITEKKHTLTDNKPYDAGREAAAEFTKRFTEKFPN